MALRLKGWLSHPLIVILILVITVLSASCSIAPGKGPGSSTAEGSDTGKGVDGVKSSISTKQSDGRQFIVTSSFQNGGDIPTKYAYGKVPGGKNINPPLAWSSPPEGTKSFALLMYDLAPIARNWVHWAVVNIPADTSEIKEGVSNTSAMPKGSVELDNSYGEKGYGGPNPPRGSGRHEYKFIIYALNTDKVNLSGFVPAAKFQSSLEGKVLGQTSISGYYER